MATYTLNKEICVFSFEGIVSYHVNNGT